MNANQLAVEFSTQSKAKGKAGNLFYEGRVIYSYGYHFPIAYIRGGRAFINSDSYSQSTSRQQSRVKAALGSFEHTAMNTSDLKALIQEERGQ